MAYFFVDDHGLINWNCNMVTFKHGWWYDMVGHWTILICYNMNVLAYYCCCLLLFSLHSFIIVVLVITLYHSVCGYEAGSLVPLSQYLRFLLSEVEELFPSTWPLLIGLKLVKVQIGFWIQARYLKQKSDHIFGLKIKWNWL